MLVRQKDDQDYAWAMKEAHALRAKCKELKEIVDSLIRENEYVCKLLKKKYNEWTD